MTDMHPDAVLDLQGTPCPQNSAIALLKLEGMKPGSILEVIVDDGEPIENVPLSFKDEGHKIINTLREDKVWKILVKRQ